MKRGVRAAVLSMIILISLFAGCTSDGVDGPQGPEGPQGPPGEDGSTLHLAVSDSDLPECNAGLQGQIFFIPNNAEFQVCSAMGWSVVDLIGQDGSNGVNGTDGQDGADGVNGTDGQDGIDGLDGNNALAVTSSEPSSTNCADGGIKIEVGVDGNGDGVLDPSEVDYTHFVCNGEDGTDGADGTNGSGSPNTMLTSISQPPATMGCTAGGRAIQQGIDNGDGAGIAQNGILEKGEIDYSTIFCSSFVVELIFDLEPYDTSGSLTPQVKGSRLYLFAQKGTYPNLFGAYFIHDTINSSTWEFTRGSTWDITRQYLQPDLGVFFDSTSYFVRNGDLHAYDFSNDTYWLVSNVSTNEYDSSIGSLTKAGDRIYFPANDGVTGRELWVHDTTNSSTWQVADISAVNDCFNGGAAISYLTLIESRLYFKACDGTSGIALWAHEPSNESTWLVADINPSNSSSTFIRPGTTPQKFLNMGSMIFFVGDDGVTGDELWIHDSSNGTTWRVTDIYPGGECPQITGCGDGLNGGSHLTAFGERVYFWANDNSSGFELWVYDTSNSSLWMTEEIFTGPNGGPGEIEAIGSRLYLNVVDPSDGLEGLWVHETLNSSTWAIIEDSQALIEQLVSVGNYLYFISGSVEREDNQLWRLKIEHSISYANS